MEKLTVRVINWGKYNPRKDYRTPVWFALSNRVVEDPDLYDFDPLEFKAFIYILCQASQKLSPTITVYFDHAQRVSNIKKSVMLRAIEKLCRIMPNPILEIVEQHETTSMISTCTDKHETSVLHTTVHNKTLHNNTGAPERHVFDFEKAFKEFPVRVKGDGCEKRFNEQIKTQEQFDNLMASLKHYKAMLALPENEWRKPKTAFATYLGSKSSGYFWHDFISPDSCRSVKQLHAKGPRPVSYPSAEKVLAEQQSSEPLPDPEKGAEYMARIRAMTSKIGNGGQKEGA